MTVHRLPVMRAWRQVYRTESVMTFALVEAFANTMQCKPAKTPAAVTASMRLTIALLEIAGA